LNPGH